MTATRASADPYVLFSRVYDLPDHEEITRAFLKRAMPIFRARPRGTPVLDLACGTGLMAELLAPRRIRVVGVDRSREMLDIARERDVPRARWIEGDLRNFDPGEPCSVATACGDILNHFPSVESLAPILRHAHTVLEPRGTLLVETTRRFCYEHYWNDRTYHIEGERGDVAMECEWDPKTEQARVRMVGYARNADETYSKFETSLTEYYHDESELEDAFLEAGFATVESELWSPWDDQHLEPDMDRTFWTATKA